MQQTLGAGALAQYQKALVYVETELKRLQRAALLQRCRQGVPPELGAPERDIVAYDAETAAQVAATRTAHEARVNDLLGEQRAARKRVRAEWRSEAHIREYGTQASEVLGNLRGQCQRLVARRDFAGAQEMQRAIAAREEVEREQAVYDYRAKYREAMQALGAEHERQLQALEDGLKGEMTALETRRQHGRVRLQAKLGGRRESGGAWARVRAGRKGEQVTPPPRLGRQARSGGASVAAPDAHSAFADDGLHMVTPEPSLLSEGAPEPAPSSRRARARVRPASSLA